MDPKELRRWQSMVSKMRVSKAWRKNRSPQNAKRLRRRELREVRLALRAACMDWEKDHEALVCELKGKNSEEGYETECFENKGSQPNGFTMELPNVIGMGAKGASEAQKSVDTSKTNLGETSTFVFQSSCWSNQEKARKLHIGDVVIEKKTLDGKISRYISDGLRRLPGADAASGIALEKLREEISQLCDYLACQAGKDRLSESLNLFQLPTLKHGYKSFDEDANSVPKEVFTSARKRTIAVMGRINLDRAEEIPVNLWDFRQKQLSIFEQEVLGPVMEKLPGGDSISLNEYIAASHRDQLIYMYGSVEEMAADPGELIEVVHVLGEVRRQAIVAGLRSREYSVLKRLISRTCSLDSFYEGEDKVQTLLDTLRTTRRILRASDEQLVSLLGGRDNFDKFAKLFGSMAHQKARKNLSYFSYFPNTVDVVKGLAREFGSIARACKVSLEELRAANLFEDNKILYEVFRRLRQLT